MPTAPSGLRRRGHLVLALLVAATGASCAGQAVAGGAPPIERAGEGPPTATSEADAPFSPPDGGLSVAAPASADDGAIAPTAVAADQSAAPSAVATTAAPTTEAPTTATPTTAAPPPAAAEEAAPAPTPVTETASPAPPAPGVAATVGANELGQIPILMYHQIVPSPGSVHDRTPADFRAELERLAAEGYVAVTAAEYASGDFSAVPAGAHPVVLTFDDSTTSQFGLGADGNPKPGTAVAILLEVAAADPRFRPAATFYVNRNPFADRGGATTLPWLVAHGFEVANHTRDHANLAEVDGAEVQHQLASNLAAIQAAVPGLDVTTMALPYGARPADRGLTVAGSSGGIAYRHAAVMYAGANPARSPFSAEYNPVVVPRIRSQARDVFEGEYSSSHWLDWLGAHPDRRFTSDGDPAVVSFPAALAGDLAPEHAPVAVPY